MRRLALVVLVLLLGTGLVVPWLALDDAPAVEPPTAFRRDDLAWVKSLFDRHDPRRQTPATTQSIRLDEAELNRLLNYAVELRRVQGVAAELGPDAATVSASLAVPRNPFGGYLNLSVELTPTTDGLEVRSLQVGSLPIPGVLADWLAKSIHRRLRDDATYAALADAFQAVHFNEGEATLDYRWQPELLTRVERKGAELLIPEADRLQMLAQAERLEALLAPYPRGASVPLARVLGPLFRESRQVHGDVREENRAALAALAAYLGGVSLPRLLESEAPSIRRAPRVGLTLHGRRDFAEHYVISAALAANGNARYARALGLVKEEEDAGHGSGFSFTDLGADHAGVRLGEAANGDQALVVQALLARTHSDADLMPDFRGLPEFMSQDEFERRFGPVGGMRYRAVIARIDARLDAHPLLGKQK